jgi:hypothetical protein
MSDDPDDTTISCGPSQFTTGATEALQARHKRWTLKIEAIS